MNEQKLELSVVLPTYNEAKNLETLKIPIPSLVKQKQIVEKFIFHETCIKTSTQKIAELKKLNVLCFEEIEKY